MFEDFVFKIFPRSGAESPSNYFSFTVQIISAHLTSFYLIIFNLLRQATVYTPLTRNYICFHWQNSLCTLKKFPKPY